METNKLHEEYQLLSQEEQILLRPDTMIGAIDEQTKYVWAFNPDNNKIEKQLLTYIPGALKLYDEILTNASDHAQRNKGVTTIKVNITNDWKVTVWNDGQGIPIEKHKTHNIYIPEMILGRLNSGSNYNDKEERYGAGRNGVGSGLVALFSSYFNIDCADGKKSYYQDITNNAKIKTEPIIKASKKSYTCVSYIADFNRLPIEQYKDAMMRLCIKRVYDIAVYNPDIKVYFNDQLIKVNNIKDWCNLHLTDDNEIFIESIDKWTIAVAESTTDSFEHCSIVNGNTTWVGGTHVEYIMNQIVKRLTDDLTKGKKGIKIKPAEIRNKFHLFLVSKIANPIFDSQTKENLSSKLKEKIELSDKFYKTLLKSNIIKSILEWVQLREQAELNKLNTKAAGKTLRIEKLSDAHKAGTVKSKDCILAIAEGDCLDENTIVKIFKDGDYIKTKIKNVQIGDLVITHNGNIRQIYGITKKVKECKKISYNNTYIIGSNEHKLFVYNTNNKNFEYLCISKIDKTIHKLVKSKLYNLESLIKVKEIIYNDKEPKFKYKLILDDGIIESSDTHKFTVLNIHTYKIQLISADKIKSGDLLVSISPS